jgi:hypothetical protein
VACSDGRALCLVQGGDCLGRDGPEPCVVREDERSRRTDVSIVALRLADGRTVLREERSDGTVAVTVSLADEAGGRGRRGRAPARPRARARRQREATASLGVRFGRRFVAEDGAAADRLIRRLADEDPPAGGAAVGAGRFLLGRGDPADERSVTLEGRAEAVAALSALGLEARGEGLAGAAEGVRVARRTGERTVVLRVAGSTGVALGAPLGLDVGAGRDRSLTVEATFDRRGTPIELTVAASRALAGKAALDRVGAVAGARASTPRRASTSPTRPRARWRPTCSTASAPSTAGPSPPPARSASASRARAASTAAATHHARRAHEGPQRRLPRRARRRGPPRDRHRAPRRRRRLRARPRLVAPPRLREPGMSARRRPRQVGSHRPAGMRTCVRMPYVELHAHSAFSFLDGASLPAELAGRR